MNKKTIKLKLLDFLTSLEEMADDAPGLSDPNTKPSNGYLSTKQAADFLGVTTRSLFNYRQNGLKCYVIGRKTLFLESDLDEFVQRFGVRRGVS